MSTKTHGLLTLLHIYADATILQQLPFTIVRYPVREIIVKSFYSRISSRYHQYNRNVNGRQILLSILHADAAVAAVAVQTQPGE
ncbi:hypothetical protein J6590_012422 [Homalodisca vitripennis]|nr:hypothetical protein J6590_012422 [Homalodisca vitripennis]